MAGDAAVDAAVETMAPAPAVVVEPASAKPAVSVSAVLAGDSGTYQG